MLHNPVRPSVKALEIFREPLCKVEPMNGVKYGELLGTFCADPKSTLGYKGFKLRVRHRAARHLKQRFRSILGRKRRNLHAASLLLMLQWA
ncbi:hypothetical protein CURTO8I2_220049 [Curtobacterium sp. 8I-2]|nr:hypothetical protein CURTO8I2_220049 [Curtobacterium sp. 8I-2]